MKRTPLHRIHKQLGARMVEFAGWEMPVLYTGVIEEHLIVRKKAGLFDVSHMGEIEIRGPSAEAAVQKVTCNDASKLAPGDCQYSALLTDKGTFVDDIIVNKLSADRFLLCVNAGNTKKDFEWIGRWASPGATVEDASDSYFQIALQGPEAAKIMASARVNLLPARPFAFVQTRFADRPTLIARTGYTGEDGFEIYGDPADAETVWTALMEKGAVPCGLGARDTLRLEAALPLYGHEIDDTVNPYEAGLGWIVKTEKGDFVGREALDSLSATSPQNTEMFEARGSDRKRVSGSQRSPSGRVGAFATARDGSAFASPRLLAGGPAALGRIQDSPLRKRLIGLEMAESGIARQRYKIFHGENEIGWVTSGTKSPSLGRSVALGYVGRDFADAGTKIGIDIHGKKRQAVVVPLPFYRRKK